MRTMTTAAALLLGLGLALPALAQDQEQQTQQNQQQGQQDQEMSADATVAIVDQTTLQLTTQEGDEFTLAEGNLVEGLQSGSKVRITYMEENGQKRVTNIEPVE